MEYGIEFLNIPHPCFSLIGLGCQPLFAIFYDIYKKKLCRLGIGSYPHLCAQAAKPERGSAKLGGLSPEDITTGLTKFRQASPAQAARNLPHRFRNRIGRYLENRPQ